MSIATTITQIETLMSGLQNEGATLTLGRILTYTPEQPQPSDFPSMAIEFPDDQPGLWKQEALGLGRNDYQLQIYIFTGVPAVTPISELNRAAVLWVKPFADKVVSNITLSGNVTQTGAYDSNITFQYWIQQINWNQMALYGFRALLGIVEKPIQTMG